MQLASLVVFFFFHTPQWKILDFEIYDVAQYLTILMNVKLYLFFLR